MQRNTCALVLAIAIGACADESALATSSQSVETVPLAHLRLAPDHTIVFYETEPGLLIIDESAVQGRARAITDAMLADGAAGVWNALGGGAAMPPELASAIERWDRVVPDEDPDAAGALRAQYGDPPISAGENRLLTQGEINWFIQTFCGIAPEHCLIFNYWAVSMSPPATQWSAVAARGMPDDTGWWLWSIQFDTHYWKGGNWTPLLPTIWIQPGWWHSVTATGKQPWNFRAYATAMPPEYELVGLRTSWLDMSTPPPPPPPCNFSTQAFTTDCYTASGQLYYANKSATGCGATASDAETLAKIRLATMAPLCSLMGPSVDCCWWAVNPATPGCQCP